MKQLPVAPEVKQASSCLDTCLTCASVHTAGTHCEGLISSAVKHQVGLQQLPGWEASCVWQHRHSICCFTNTLWRLRNNMQG